MVSLSRFTKEYGMRINVKKTKAMCISRQGHHKVKVNIEGQQVEQVHQYRYLGSLISSDGIVKVIYEAELLWVNKIS